MNQGAVGDPDAGEGGVPEYLCPSELFDEMCFHQGQPRPHWQYFMRALGEMDAAELHARRREIRGLLRDNGVTYNAYDDPAGLDRPWQLDIIPLLISSEEWSRIERGLAQRAELLNLLLADIYGNGEVLRKNLLPLELIYSHPGFLRQAVGLDVPRQRYLPLYAADLARHADGQFHVVRDRTQAPPGAGYALENRLVLSRIFPSLFRDAHVHRLALFFRALRATLAHLAGSRSGEGRVVLMSPGADSETYFEHAYLAKYLGYTLVQGGDLTVREGRVYLKTLDGLQAVDVILRRVNDEFCDPLELRQDSYLGVAGLLQAARLGRVALANPLGSAVLENPGLNQFMPALCRHFLGEELLLPAPETWWCGGQREREYVLDHLDDLIIRRVVAAPGATSVSGRNLTAEQRDSLRRQIMARPRAFVAQEALNPSSLPVWQENGLEARQMVLRAFLTASEEDYAVMPGGLTRVASATGQWGISGDSGGITKDTWVLASEPEKQLSLMINSENPAIQAEAGGELSSRVAENLFWLGRYAERSDGIVRLLRAVLLYVVEQPREYPQNRSVFYSLLRAVTYLTETYPGFVGEGAEQRLAAPREELLSLLLDPERPGSLAYNLNALLFSARSVRDRISPDIWRVFNLIHAELDLLQVRRETLAGSGGEALDEMINATLDKLNHLIIAFAAFNGLTVESMSHGQGWRFLMIGRYLERAQHTLQLLRATVASIADNESALLEHVLNICDSQMTYRRRYRSQALAMPVLELLLADHDNPRALHFQLRHLHDQVRGLPRKTTLAYRSSEEKLILEALTQLRLAELEELVKPDATGSLRAGLDQLLVRLGHLLPRLSEAMTGSYFSHAEQPSQLVRYAVD